MAKLPFCWCSPAVGAIAFATLLHGWHLYLGFTVAGIGLFIGLIRWNRRY